MDDNEPSPSGTPTTRPAWNKGKIIDPRPPLRPRHVWSIRAKLDLERRLRDLALFNLAIDSKLGGCDLIALRVSDVAPNGYALDRASVRPEEDRSTCSPRVDRADAAVDRRISSQYRPEAGTVPIPGPGWIGSVSTSPYILVRKHAVCVLGERRLGDAVGRQVIAQLRAIAQTDPDSEVRRLAALSLQWWKADR